MQEYKKISITKDEVIPTAERMRSSGVALAMIHGFVNDEGKPNISYEYEVGNGIESYTVDGEDVLPSISGIYDLGAEWAEREITELMEITFEGLDTSKRLFMPDNMLDGQGQIIVTPMDELIDKAHGKEGE
ncbi:MAG: NADH-quinone oxidoreductase subunit C [Oscillospiraceae bacterium]|nr:NADH-quinone oxidoreductase subunit C [Oscillospiraceae bacterium]